MSSASTGASALEPIFEVFNLFNSKNLLVPQTTNLIFNFDGTVPSRPRRPAPDADSAHD